MGESLFAKLRSVLSRQKTSKISAPEEPQASANLSRLKLGGRASASAAPTIPDMTGPDISAFAASPAASAHTHSDHITPVGVQFFAEVPLQQSAEEIVTVSKRASNCLTADMSPAGDGHWTVSVTLNMAPVPQEIHTVESVLSDWASKLGGSSKGWGLAQGRTAA